VGRTNKLRQPLGPWIASHHNVSWNTWYDNESKYIYHSTPTGTSVFRDTSYTSGKLRGHSRTEAQTEWQHDKLIPIDMIEIQEHQIVTTLPSSIAPITTVHNFAVGQSENP
jgi:hypothetical protein